MPKKKRSQRLVPNDNPSPNLSWLYILLLTGLVWLWFIGNPFSLPEVSWKQFEKEMLVKGDVEKLDVINNERVEIYIKIDSLGKPSYKNIPKGLFSKKPVRGPHYYFNIGSVDVFYAEVEKVQEKLPKEQHVIISYSKRENWGRSIFGWLLFFGILVLFWSFLLRGVSSRMQGTGTSIFNFGQSKARVLEKGAKTRKTFKDVAGLEEAKEEIYELVKFLKSPEQYKRLGAKIPKGVLLVGPPGTGKTLLAKAVAGEADVPFFSLSGSEFIEMFVGVGAARMRDLFQKAKSKAPSIIFIDEIDTIGRTRSGINAFQANDERDSTLNQLLAELDGFDTDTGVIVLAATNRGDILDPALLRPGRFDRHVYLELPNLKERIEIFKVHMKPLKLSKDVDKEELGAQTPGFSGADIANICNEAALIAARKDKKGIEKQDFMDAIDRVVGGMEKKSKIITQEEKKRVSYHEAGHVTSGWFLEHTNSILKVSIIPRGRSLGSAWYLPEEHQIITKAEFLDTICMSLGGRAAEELEFGEISSNALDDLEKVTKLAYTMVLHYGLSDQLRNISYFDSTGRLEQSLLKPYSEKTAEKVDAEVQKIIDECYKKSKEIIKTHKKKLDLLASLLIEKEIIYKDEIEKILGKKK